MMETIKWLWSVYQMRKIYKDKRLLFSGRKELLDSARPLVGMQFLSSDVVAYPDAFFFIKPEDARRMMDNFEVMQRHKMNGLNNQTVDTLTQK